MSEDATKEAVEAIEANLKEEGIFDEPKVEEKVDAKEEKEEVNVSEKEEEPVLEEVSSKPELTEVEEEASAKGWKPNGPKSAEEFLRAEPLYDEIKQRGKEIKTLRSQVDELMKHVTGLKKAGYEEKLDIIKAERADAVARSDLDSVEYLDEELNKVKSELNKEEGTPQMPQAALDFVERHKDILNDYSLESQHIKDFINERDIQLAAYNLDPETHIKTLERDLQTQYPDKFGVKTQSKPNISAVESDSRPVTTKGKSKYSFSDLTQDQKNIYKFMEKRGDMTGAEYIKQLVDIGELK